MVINFFCPQKSIIYGKKPLFLSSFMIKVIAILTMTLDHIGYSLKTYNVSSELAEVFRNLGRLALPLFCFMIVEGVLHTKSFKKYALRLGIALIAVAIGMIIVEYLPLFSDLSIRGDGNIFVDLLLGATAVYCLKDKRAWVKALAILPLGFAIGASFANGFECIECGRKVWIIPFFLRTQANFYGVLLIIGFYVAHVIGDLYIKYVTKDIYRGTKYERLAKNLMSFLVLIIINLVFYFGSMYIDNSIINYLDVELQLVSIFAGIIIIFYNEDKGYDAYWFKYGCYLYYPIHMIVIYALFALLF